MKTSVSVTALFISLLPLSVFAKDTSAASYKNTFEAAVKIFNAGGFEKAYEEFYKLYLIKSDDPKVNFYLGRCALELKKYDEAVAAFDRVLIAEPMHTRGHLEMARAYFEQKEFGMAEAEFDEALKANLPKQVKEQVAEYKKAIEESRQKHFINGFLSAGIGYDSNINNGIGTKDYSVPSFGISLTGEPPKEDYYHSETAGINHIYDMKDIKGGMFWQDNLTLYAQSYRNAITNNSRYIGISTGPAYRTNGYEAAVSLTADKLVYGGLDYMYSLGLSPRASYKLTDSVILEGYYSLKNKLYYYDNWARNSIYQELSMGARKLFASTGSVISGAFVLSKETERFSDNSNTPARTDVSNFSRGVNISFYYPLMEGLDLTGGFSAKATSYTDTDTSFLKREKDLTLAYNAGILKTVAKNGIVNCGYSYSNNRSNFENKVYQKRGFNIGYIYSF